MRDSCHVLCVHILTPPNARTIWDTLRKSPENSNPAPAAHASEGSWAAVKELNLSYFIGETLLFTTYIYPL